MRAEIKRMKGMLPATMGVAMALLSGMALAEEKTAQTPTQSQLPTQPRSGVVSAQTSLPSRGHRPKTPSVSGWALQSGMQKYSSSLLLPVGSRLRAHSYTLSGSDNDNSYGANEKTLDLQCRMYRIASDSSETLIYDSIDRHGSCASGSVYLSENEIGHKIKITHYFKTDPDSYSGYEAIPTESLETVFMTSQSVSDIYDVRKTEVSPSYKEILHSDPKGIEITVKAFDSKNRPVTGLKITLGGKLSSSSPDDAKLSHTPSIDNGDGTYTMYAKSSHAGSFYFVVIYMNGTVGYDDYVHLSFR